MGLLNLLQENNCQILEDKFVLTSREVLHGQRTYGIELEYLYAPDVSRMSCIAFLLGTDALEYEDFRDHVRNSLSYISPLQMETFQQDQMNDELVLLPMSLQAFYALSSHLSIVFKSLSHQGYEPWSPTEDVGLHISVDKNLVPPIAMHRLLWWLYHNNKFWVWMSGRRNMSTARADIPSLLGDKYHTWEESFRYSHAESRFNSWVTAFTDGGYSSIGGFRTYSDRPYFQFTHFASTTSVAELLCKIEFVDALLDWCIDKEDYNVHNFINNLPKNQYEHLKESLKSVKL